MLTIACIVDDDATAFELGVAAEVFGTDRSDRGVPRNDFRVVTATPGPVRLAGGLGLPIMVEEGLEFADRADVVIVLPYDDCSDDAECSLPVARVLQRAVVRGARVLTLCTGAFVAARAGVLDGRRVATHWRHTDALAEQFPELVVDRDALWVDDGPITTSAGTAAAIDAALHIVRELQGAQVAATIARSMVVPPLRDGGQSQFAVGPVAEQRAETLAPLIDWMVEHLDQEHSVAALARRANLSERTFARRFREELGATPAAWLTSQRVQRAQALLEATDLGLDAVAQQAGFGTAALLRHHFSRQLGVSPSAYRRRFACPEPSMA
ncbi:helix-turn-helix domain-containing protein [Agrococcus carbonis]|uniref:Transcriptional regulator GlxA family, contains an amidase domain and an AraC-type DNA-binding HTH domain n=1 Tax=Agrococcus carbonis TaxID=684552 RepID=A0A1H1QAS7_9MICO|nr:helix-turn-helix domain-containing protein [Agrococcus carbonis]SDS20484.1 Transcriptional regulator GlxA family, contains an amidase domain and an AraC-type DNA-binding HTH domain [Agrococcus carbonis]